MSAALRFDTDKLKGALEDILEIGGAEVFPALAGVVFGVLDDMTGTFRLAFDSGRGFVERLTVEILADTLHSEDRL